MTVAGFRQSFAWWSFTMAMSEPDQARLLSQAAAIGIEGVEMLPASRWDDARDAGLDIVTLTGHDIERGFNDPANHAELHERVGGAVEEAAGGGVPMVIVFSGNDAGLPDDVAIGNCAEGLAPLAEQATARGVTLVLELLNSKVDHPGYQCDRSWWGFEVARRVDSPGLRVLYDGYHMQLMEGDLSRTLKEHLPLVGHVHTGGAPGRRDLDDRQEINWRAIAGLLRHLGYSGWVGHEFIPRADPVAALRHAHGLFVDPAATT